MPHGIKGIFVTDKAIIGKNVTIFQQVTIGVKDIKDPYGPRIGDNVQIGAGAKITGDICIGDNAKIGPNCVVWFDVPPNSIVTVSRASVIVHNEK